MLMDRARKFLLDQIDTEPSKTASDDPPRLTLNALEKIRMSRSRERILENLDEMYREAFERAKETQDPSQMARPHVHSVAPEICSRFRMVVKEFAQPALPFERVAAPARRH